ncbi:Phosphatidylserine decarboxylase proenzyme [Candidatus Bealeia paramacronuclearis]|uniref:Phosphatidylserine decarboxylase proenzyme n=2 Tax=Candidatus Bealeia paramacronuclearis TaxID=1921001 RepID=A0ABZ2C3D4_9PROT|nr:Phosphatidylserine decarboxylase proenzyme [Candidatus Bealeia paramacronuclearis]
MWQFLAPIHKAGWPFVAIFAVGTFLLSLMSSFLGIVGVGLTLWCIYFFRDPERVTPQDSQVVVSPADGYVSMITKAVPPQELRWQEGELTRVSIFLNVFDVHVNRIPVSGKIIKAHYYPGKFFNASLDKASEFNERNSLVIKTEGGQEILVVQIAGLIARRILCEAKDGDDVKAGDRYGIIRFGSRTDIYLPKGVDSQVLVGQYMIGGETVIARL